MDDINQTKKEIPEKVTIKRLLEILRATGKNYDTEKIKASFDYAAKLHCGQFRQSGEEYISHPVAVAEIVAGLELDTDSICAALLHDTVEDCSDKTNLQDIEKKFGKEVALLVDGLTKIVVLQIEDKEEAHIENIRKMLLAMSKDIRVIFIKLCDRLHNIRTLAAKSDSKQRTIALETMQVYAPLAHRLGMQKIKQELENISLSYLDPYGYNEVKTHVEEKYGQSLNLIENLRNHIDAKLTDNNLKFTLEGRIKSVYSIYKKMYNQNKSFDEIYDFYALRIIVDTELECYTVLGIIHEMYKSIPGRFKDYISTPKPNLYRSLHTTVIGREGIPFEVQIRTWDMHHIAEYGIAAHWKYKSGDRSSEEIDKKLEWIARLIETEDDTHDPEEFMHAIKTDIFHDETFVFTPKGDVISLPQGATVIDFAYSIHSAIGNKMVGAKINGMIVPIDKSPENGEIVEIITSNSSKGPSRDWLKIVKTGEAKNKIRQWFKREKRDENILVGRGMIEAELKKHSRNFTDTQMNEAVTSVARRIGIQSAEDLYNTLGYGGITLSKITSKLKDEFARIVKIDEPANEEKQVHIAKPKNIKSGGIIIDGEPGCLVKFARCCNPLPGDSVIGFVTKGFGVSVHKKDCPNILMGLANNEYKNRLVKAEWEKEAAGTAGEYEALIQIFAYDRIGIIADVSMALADMRVSILAINSQKKSNDTLILNLKISCKNIEHYKSIVSRLRSLKDITDVTRGFS